MFNKFALFICICLATFFSSQLNAAGILGSLTQSNLASEVKATGTAESVIDLNVRIDIPDQYRRHADESPVEYIGTQKIDKLKGVTLWGTLIRPKDDAADIAAGRMTKRPTIIVATCYRREFCIIPWGVPLVKHGYNVLGIDLRGSASAEGKWDIFTFEEQYDVAYIVDHWLPGDKAEGGIENGQAWSDGTSGMIGASYMAITQLNTAGLCLRDKNGEPEHLKALFTYVPQSDPYKETLMQNGNLDIWFMVGLWLPLTDILAILPPLSILGENELVPTKDELNDAATAWKDHMANIESHIKLAMDPGLEYDGDFINPRSSMQYWPVKPEGGWMYLGNTEETEKFKGQPIPEGERVIPGKLPVFVLGGWFCIFTKGTLNHYEYGLSQHSTGDKALLMGPWYHMDGSMGMGLPDLYKTQAIAARWFDWKIKGKVDSFMTKFPVLLYVMGEDRWRAEKTWPLPASRVEKKKLWLSGKKASGISGDSFTTGVYSNAKNNYSLTWQTDSLDYTTNSNTPVLKHRPANLHGELSRSMVRFYIGVPDIANIIARAISGKPGAGDNAPWEDERDDEKGVLTFTTEPLEKDVEITGPVKLTFWASTTFDTFGADAWDSVLGLIKKYFNIDEPNLLFNMMNRKDVQWVTELNDVFEDGRAKNLTSGWLAASHRPYDPDDTKELDQSYKAFDPFYSYPDLHPDMIEENILYPYVIELWPTCNVFKKGHRIRLSISGSDFPHFLPVLRPSDNTFVIDAEHPANIEFDLVKSDNEGKTWKWIGSKSNYLSKYSDGYNANQAANAYLMGPEPEDETDDGDSGDDSQKASTEDASSDGGSSGSTFCFINSARI
jgi:uncharacterized protein